MSQRQSDLADLVLKVHRGLSLYLHAYVQQHDLPLSTLVVFGTVQRLPGVTLSEIARQSGFAKSHVKAIVDELHRQGLLRKAGDESDQRLIRLSLTAAGEARFQSFRRAMQDHLSALLRDLDEAQETQLSRGLQVLQTALAPVQVPEAC